MSEFALQMRSISKTYGSIRANDSVTIQVRPGTIHGLAGENGAGKSTLMKTLFGMVEPDHSEDPESGIFIDHEKVSFRTPLEAIARGIGMVQQHFALAGPLTALDNIILGSEPCHGLVIDRERARKDIEAVAGKKLTVAWDLSAEILPIGIQQRIEILKLLYRKARILILDEPTAVLTPSEVDHLFSLIKAMRSEGKTIIIITHKIQELLSLCDEVTVLRQGKVTASLSGKDLTQDKIVHAMIGRPLSPKRNKVNEFGEPILKIENLSATAEGARSYIEGASFSARKKEIVGIAGVEGNGQQALVEALLDLCRSSGAVSKPRKIGLISEDRHTQSLWLDASVAENCALGHLDKFSKFGFVEATKLEKHSEKILAPYSVKLSSLNQPVRALSGGNQQKVVVAREVDSKNPDLLIACQPTRGVDVGSIETIHERILALQARGAGVLLISSELEELCHLSNRILVLFRNKIVGEFKGPDYDTYKIGRLMTGAGN